jgi:2-oxoglutarate ferredoxin oxidoreductase subunit alpha
VVEAARIAVHYRTPVIVLSDGTLANGSEPWLVPDVSETRPIEPDFATAPNSPDGGSQFWPYLRDQQTLARPWAIPGTPGLEHRVGGLEKADGPGTISYDPANHERMVRLRQAKIDRIEVGDLEVDDPTAADPNPAGLLVIGWGSTYGPIVAAARRVRGLGHRVATANLRHLNPLPANLGEVLARYPRVLMPEMNLGQLALLLRGRYLIDVQSCTKISGVSFQVEELQNVFLDHLLDPAGAHA